ncbi:hypothetical protein Esi_0213_0024 [Ectocarpus siliculosus]|uniref:Uncharacterized protein n=1 Tax=Ectocarpus siliculosus TaxID=2880 RepID=D7FRD3_ECTSI|nr:hypothetical protein Esi_0213_0024 [Ectocarpus siliculosus]|eukprot:CBJ30724.1 hypothetical protein Esi_0213_0024 [Ectocarpus siliculosus]
MIRKGDGSHKAWMSCLECLTSVDRVSLDIDFFVEEISFRVGVFCPAPSGFRPGGVKRLLALQTTPTGWRRRSKRSSIDCGFEDMQEMAAAVVSNMCSCTGPDSTASAGDATAVDRTEADDAGNGEDVGGQEPDAHGIDANPPKGGVL